MDKAAIPEATTKTPQRYNVKSPSHPVYNHTINLNVGIVGRRANPGANPAGTTSLQTASLGWTFSGLPASNIQRDYGARDPAVDD